MILLAVWAGTAFLFGFCAYWCMERLGVRPVEYATDTFGRKWVVRSKGEHGMVINGRSLTEYTYAFRVESYVRDDNDEEVTWAGVLNRFPSHREEAESMLGGVS